MRQLILGLAIVLVCALICATAVAADGVSQLLTLEQRVEARRVVEEIYWQKRIWPESNPGAKPP